MATDPWAGFIDLTDSAGGTAVAGDDPWAGFIEVEPAPPAPDPGPLPSAPPEMAEFPVGATEAAPSNGDAEHQAGMANIRGMGADRLAEQPRTEALDHYQSINRLRGNVEDQFGIDVPDGMPLPDLYPVAPEDQASVDAFNQTLAGVQDQRQLDAQSNLADYEASAPRTLDANEHPSGSRHLNDQGRWDQQQAERQEQLRSSVVPEEVRATTPEAPEEGTWESLGIDRDAMATGPDAYNQNLQIAADRETESRGPITGSAPYRIAEGAVSAAVDAVANPMLAAEAALGFEHAGDMLADRQADSDIRSMREMGWVERTASGIVDSVSQSATLAATGGLPAIIVGFMTNSYLDSKREALKGGATEEEARKIALANAAVEGGVMSLFNMVGLGGLEREIRRLPKWAGFKQFLKQTAAEVTEEEITTLGQNLASTGTPGDAQSFIDTAVQAIGTMGLVGGSQRIINFIQNPSKQNRKAAGIPEEVARTKPEREALAASIVAAAPQYDPTSQEVAVAEPLTAPLPGGEAVEAPVTPVDALPTDAASEPEVVPIAPTEAAEGVARAPDPVVSEQAPSDDIPPHMPASYVQAKKRADGKWRLVFRGTDNEVFLGELFQSANEARQTFLAHQAKQTAPTSNPPEIAVESPQVQAEPEVVSDVEAPEPPIVAEATPVAPPRKKRLGDKKAPAPISETVSSIPEAPATSPAAPKTKAGLTLEKMKADQNARNIKSGYGNSPSTAKAWLRDAISRQGSSDPAEIAAWIEKGFGNENYWKLLKQDGVTLEEAVAREMGGKAVDPNAAERQRIADGTKRIGDTAADRPAPAEQPKAPTPVDAFVADKTPMARKKAQDALNKRVSHNGEFMSRREMIERAIERGATVVTARRKDEAARRRLESQLERLRDAPFNENHPDRIKYNEIREQLKDGGPYTQERRLEYPGKTYLLEVDASKTAMDYAEHLLNQKAAPPSETPGESAAPARMTAERFTQQVRETATSPEEAENIVSVYQALADAEGVSLDQWVGDEFRGVMKGEQEKDSVVLKQRRAKRLGEKKGDALGQLAPGETFEVGSPLRGQWTVKIGGSKYKAGTPTKMTGAIVPVGRGLADVVSDDGYTSRHRISAIDFASEAELTRQREQLDAVNAEFDRKRKAARNAGMVRGSNVAYLSDRGLAELKKAHDKHGIVWEPSDRSEATYIRFDADNGVRQQIRYARHAPVYGASKDGKQIDDWGDLLPAIEELKKNPRRAYVPASENVLEAAQSLRAIDADALRVEGAAKNRQAAVDQYGDALAQRQRDNDIIRAETHILREDGRAIVRMFEAQDESSWLHETAHVLFNRVRKQGGERLAEFEKAFGVEPGGAWSEAKHEHVARAWERYFREGKAPTEGLRKVFEDFKKWLTKVYKSIKGSPLDVQMTPEIRALFDKLLTPQKRIGDKKAVPVREEKPVESVPAEAGAVESKPVDPVREKEVDEPIPAYTRTTPREGDSQSTREVSRELMQKAREKELEIERTTKPLEDLLKRTRRNAYKKRGELQGQIQDKQRAANDARKEFRTHQDALREAELEDAIEKASSIDHFNMGLYELESLRATRELNRSEELRRFDRKASEAAQEKRNEHQAEADRHAHNVMAAIRHIAQEDARLNKDEINDVESDVFRDFSVTSRSPLKDSVTKAAERRLEARASMSISTASQAFLSPERRQAYQDRIAELKDAGPSWYKQYEAIAKEAAKENDDARAGVKAQQAEEAEKQRAENAKKEKALRDKRKADNRKIAAEGRFWKELGDRSRKIKGKKGEVEVTRIDDKKVESKERRKAEILDDNLAITYTEEGGDGGKKEYRLTHRPSGLSLGTSSVANLKQLAQLISEVGVDLATAGTIGADSNKLLGKVVRAWDNSSLETLPEDIADKFRATIKTAETAVTADLMLDAVDLGLYGNNKPNGLGKVKEMAKDTPEFLHEPVFTVDDNRQLMFRDGVTYHFKPDVLNLDESDLMPGQTVGINLEDIGLKQITAEEAVAKSLGAWGFKNIRQKDDGTIVAKWGDSPVTLYGSGKEWTVLHKGSSDAQTKAENTAVQLLRKMHFFKAEPAKPQKRKLGGKQGEGLQGAASAGPALQPAKPRVIPHTPKSQRQIIADLSKALKVPIRFGRMKSTKFGGFFNPLADLIVSRKANDTPIVTHEVGHKLDQMFNLSSKKNIRAELDALGDPSTPGSRSSWTPSKSRTYKLGEGVAEFVRYWLTEPTRAAVIAPNTFVEFQAALDANKDAGDALRQAQEDIHVWRTAEPQARLRSHISTGENPNKTRYTLSQVTRDLVDDLHFMRLAAEDAKKGKPGLAPSKDPYLLARNLRGSYGMAATFIRDGAVKFDDKSVDIGSSLEDALKPVAGRMTDFRDWIVAKRADELHRQGKETGLVPADVSVVAKKFDNDPDFKRAFAAVKKWNDDVLQYAVDAGLVTTGSASAMRQMNLDYVPFHRLFEVGANEPSSQESYGTGSGLNPGKPASLKRLKGSTRNIVDPIETMVKNAYAIITAAEKSAISNAVADMANLPGMGKWVEEVAGPKKETKVGLDAIRDQLETEGADLSQVPDDLLMTFWRQATHPAFGENTIRVVRPGGKLAFYRLNRHLHDTFQALDLDDVGSLVKILSAPAQALRAGVVLEPSFNLANAFRDTFGAAVVGKYGALPFETTLKGVAAMIGNPQLVAEWAAAGGRSSIEADFFDRKKMQAFIKAKVSKDLTAAERALLVARSPLSALRWMSTTFEEATRIGEYQKAFDALTKSGMPEGEARRLAAFEARDRQDFAKGGAKTKIIRRGVPFWNAALQGNIKLAQAFKERPQRTILAGLAFVTLPKLLEQALNWDDEDYWDRPQWERDAFFLIPIGKDDAGHTRFLRLPTPFEIGIIFGTVPGRMLQWAKDHDPDSVKDLPSLLLKHSVPSPLSNSATLIQETFLSGPQGWSIFRGRPIVPDSLKDLPPDLQWTAQTSALAKKIGELSGVSPMKIDYLIESTTGGMGKVLSGRQIPGERFVTTPLPYSNQAMTDFYEIRNDLDEQHARYRQAGEEEGFGPVMRQDFAEAAKKIAAVRDRVAAEKDEAKKVAIQEEALQIAKQLVADYRKNPQPDEAVKRRAIKQGETGILSHGQPEQQDHETDIAFASRDAKWRAERQAALAWLREHKDSPAVQDALKETFGKPYTSLWKGDKPHAEKVRAKKLKAEFGF